MEATAPAMETTGRYLLVLAEEAITEVARILDAKAGLRTVSTADFTAGALNLEKLQPTDALFFDKLGVVAIQADEEQLEALTQASGEDKPILAVEPDRFVYAFAREEPSREEMGETWGLRATNVAHSKLSGKGIKVAVLDTGFDLKHPDFVGRSIVPRSFVLREGADDEHGHGTHCIGTACGPKQPLVFPRYGVAFECEIFSGKVLDKQGHGSGEQVLAGINWAVTNGCAVISLSLSTPVQPGQTFSRAFEVAASRALRAGTVIIAAAGNDSQREFGKAPKPVSHPANCPSIVAVGAVDERMQIAPFSNSGKVEIVGPGLGVYSTWPMPTRYRTLSGTSMATPHVTGIAALFAEEDFALRGHQLRDRLLRTARSLALSAFDVGAGLIQAP